MPAYFPWRAKKGGGGDRTVKRTDLLTLSANEIANRERMGRYQPASAAGLAERERTYEEGRTKPGINSGRRMYVRTDGRTDADGVREPRARETGTRD